MAVDVLDVDALLQKTSRTFALAIPLLPEPLKETVGLAYLLFRIADTFEDAVAWPPAQRLQALAWFTRALQQPAERAPRFDDLARMIAADAPINHAGYLELLQQTPAVVAAVDALQPRLRGPVLHHAVRTAEGMARVVLETDAQGAVRLQSLQALRDYCYVVAGIVGELLTDVFVADTPSLASQRAALDAEAVAVGEALQLVNILKDAAGDAVEGRVFLPADVPLAEVYALARADLEAGDRYVAALERGGAPRGCIAFTALSLVLARKALVGLEREGAGFKVSRAEVGQTFTSLMAAVDAGQPLCLSALAAG